MKRTYSEYSIGVGVAREVRKAGRGDVGRRRSSEGRAMSSMRAMTWQLEWMMRVMPDIQDRAAKVKER